MARIPDEVTFKRKWELGLQMIGRAQEWGLPVGVVVTDAGYGVATELRVGLRKRGLQYVVGIPWLSTGLCAPARGVQWGWRCSTGGRARPARSEPRVGSLAPASGDSWRIWARFSEARCARHRLLRLRLLSSSDQPAFPWELWARPGDPGVRAKREPGFRPACQQLRRTGPLSREGGGMWCRR
ncbi:TPA: hypothetical protein DCY67_04165 [Candidatus Acetothermia bacterium]|nr:hypothetical protein [Candidatus Acetothermia bacterium]